jgi:hypothetical protein
MWGPSSEAKNINLIYPNFMLEAWIGNVEVSSVT